MIRFTPIQVGLRPIEEQASHLSAHNPNSPNHAHSPTRQQTLSDYSEFLTIQSFTRLTSPCSTTTEPNQELQVPPLSTPNRLPSPSNPLKRKVTDKELDFFAKRLRIVARGPEPVYFDPKTVALIPQSSLEYFIPKERQKTEDEAHNRNSFYHTLSEICSHSIANPNSPTYTAKETGLIKPPPSP